MCVSTIDLISVTLRSYIKPRELAVMSRVLVLSSSTRVSCHVMCVSIDLISVTLRSYIKSRELAVMSCVIVLSSSHES